MSNPFWIVRTYADNGALLHQSMHASDPGQPRVEVQRFDPAPFNLHPEDHDPVYDPEMLEDDDE